MRTELSLVIPCYNEAANLPLVLERCGALVAEPGVEVILVGQRLDGRDAPASCVSCCRRFPVAAARAYQSIRVTASAFWRG